jgi:phage baseplate assembly protein W
MAFNVKRIDPLDLQPRKAIGVSLPFSGKGVFNSTYTSKDAIKTNLINLLLTGNGERYLNPFLGTGLRSYLFENITEDTLRRAKADITNTINVYFPRVEILELQIASEPDTNTFITYLRYRVTESDIQDEIIINIEQ